MNLTQHLEHIIGLVERSAPYLEIKSSLLAMHEEVHGTEQAAANAIKLAEKQKSTTNSSPPEVATQLAELQKAILELKQQYQDLKDNPPDARWS